MLHRLKELAGKRESFAFESTLSARSYASWIGQLRRERDYAFKLVFLWIPNEDHAVQRVGERVRLGGHDIPEETIRRRYRAGLRNFFSLYQPISDFWHVYDNSSDRGPRLIALGSGRKAEGVPDAEGWREFQRSGEA